MNNKELEFGVIADTMALQSARIAELEAKIAGHPGQVEQAYKEGCKSGNTTGWRPMSSDDIDEFWKSSRAYARLKGEKE